VGAVCTVCNLVVAAMIIWNTVYLTVAYCVGTNLAELYGSDKRAAMIVVAVDLDRGALLAGAPVDPHSVPLAAILPPAWSAEPEVGPDGSLAMAARIRCRYRARAHPADARGPLRGLRVARRSRLGLD
jgi:hypothetical protein